jgi:hypothetical protein
VDKGYIYITGTGTDPGLKNNLNDPVFGEDPTLGACMPNIRRVVQKGDFIFVVSGSAPGVQQYVVGAMEVADKITALQAYDRFPQHRLRIGNDNRLQGNVIVSEDGTQHPLDRHQAATFANRVKNYIVGTNAISLETPAEVAAGRLRSLEKLGDIFGKRGNRAIDIFGRWGRLEERQIKDLLAWLEGIKRDAA